MEQIVMPEDILVKLTYLPHAVSGHKPQHAL